MLQKQIPHGAYSLPGPETIDMCRDQPWPDGHRAGEGRVSRDKIYHVEIL